MGDSHHAVVLHAKDNFATFFIKYNPAPEMRSFKSMLLQNLFGLSGATLKDHSCILKYSVHQRFKYFMFALITSHIVCPLSGVVGF